MSEVTLKAVNPGQADGTAPPEGTAIIRPLTHVRAVRERYLQRFADPAEAAASRSARAWAWALGETALAPVTDRPTTSPPSRAEIEAELTEADQRRVHGTREGRADAAATVLRWLLGTDDHVPVRCSDPGELVGGFGDIVRSREQIADLVELAQPAQRAAAGRSLDTGSAPGDREHARREADYLDGVLMTLAWVGGERAETPITHVQVEMMTRTLKRERLHAEDVIEHGADRHAAGRPSRFYGEGIQSTISWLLGDSTVSPYPLAKPSTNR